MKNKLTRFHIFIAFVIHVVVISLCSFFQGITTIHNKFIVLGAHSRKPSKALYRPSNKPIPFVGDRSSFDRRRKQIQETKRLAQEKKRRLLQEKIRKKKQSKRDLEKKKKQAQKLAQKRKTQNKKKKVQVKKVHKKPQKKEPPKTSLTKLKKKTKKVKNKPTKKKKMQVKKTPAQEELLNPKKQKKEAEKVVKREEPKDVELDSKKLAGLEKKLEKELEDLESLDQDLQFSLDYVSNSRLRKYQEYVQKEVGRLWQPPVGVPKSTECQVSFVINKYGKVHRFEFVQRSNILIYDLSISRVAKKFAFNQCLWGKCFTINFRQ